MFDNQSATGDPSAGQLSSTIATGMTVYDANGEKIGKVNDYDLSAGYIDVQKGWLFPKDIYVPLSAVASTEPDAVYLSLVKDVLSDSRYETPPAGAATVAGAVTDTADLATDTWGYAGTTGTAAPSGDLAGIDQRDVRIPVREEELVAGKRAEEQGRVHVHKDVVEEQETVEVPVTRERVTVERVPYSGSAEGIATEDTFTERDIDVPVMGEEVVAEKRVRGVEEVRIRKEAVTDTVPVSDTVRKERVSVDADPDDLLAGNTSGTSVKGSAERVRDRLEDAAVDATGQARRTGRDI